MKNIGKTPYLLVHSVKGELCLPLVGRNYWTIGRSKDNDFVISEQSISRNHAILQSTETEEFYLIDLGSRNGTFVNGRRVIIPATLKNTDKITFGKTEVDFHCPLSTRQALLSQAKATRDTLTFALHERRLMSVIVVDMRDFTILARQLDEKVLSSLIGSWFREAGNIIRNAGSWVDKYIGDAIMAIWFHGEEEVSQEAILQVFQAVSDLNKMTQSLSRQYPLPFQLRIGAGISTGYAMVGNTGSGDHPDYTAIGDTVNSAFRLESSTKQIELDIAVGERTYSYLANLQEAEQWFHQYSVIFKGNETATPTYGTTFEALAHFLQANLISKQ